MARANETSHGDKIYSSRIIKASALLPDTKTLLAHWDESLTVQENLDCIRRENIFGKASRSRIEDILTIFRQRYLTSEAITGSLVTLVRENFLTEGLDRILYFYAAQSDRLLHDIVTEVLAPFRLRGKMDVTVLDIQSAVLHWMNEGKTVGQWSDETVLRVTQGLLSTLRDFGVLEGILHKHIAPIYLLVEAFAYIAFYLQQSQPSGELLLRHPEWQLFFLTHHGVEQLFLEAHQQRLLEYHAAGSVIRITFPTTSIEEYAHALTQRAY
jgi:Putative inner membrane protein (DUF1819)